MLLTSTAVIGVVDETVIKVGCVKTVSNSGKGLNSGVGSFTDSKADVSAAVGIVDGTWVFPNVIGMVTGAGRGSSRGGSVSSSALVMTISPCNVDFTAIGATLETMVRAGGT